MYLSTSQEGVNPMTNTTELTNNIPEGVKPQKEVLIYQAEEDVMPVEQVDVNRSI